MLGTTLAGRFRVDALAGRGGMGVVYRATDLTDAFAVGALFYEMLAGAPAFSGESVLAVLAKVLFADPPELDIDDARWPRVAALLDELLAKEAGRRPADLTGLAVAARQLRGAPSRWPATPPVSTRERRLVAVLLTSPGPPDSAPTLAIDAGPTRSTPRASVQLRTARRRMPPSIVRPRVCVTRRRGRSRSARRPRVSLASASRSRRAGRWGPRGARSRLPCSGSSPGSWVARRSSRSSRRWSPSRSKNARSGARPPRSGRAGLVARDP